MRLQGITTGILAVCLVSAIAASTTAFSATFEPKPKDVCSKSANASGGLVLDPRKLVGLLVEKNAGVTSIDLDPNGGGVVFPENARALLDPASFCAKWGCSKQVQSSLGVAFVELLNFVARHSAPPQTAPFVDTSALQGDRLQQFLLGNARSTNLCVLAPPPADSPAQARTAEEPKIGGVPWSELPHYFALRQNVEDLQIPQDDAKFKGVKQASASWSDDRVARKSSFAVNLAAGYTVGPISLDDEARFVGQATPFLAYDHQFVQADTPVKSSRAQNIGFGLLSDLLTPVPFSGGRQEFQFFPKYVRSLSNDAEVLSGNLVYTPMYGIRGIDNVFYVVPDLLSFQITPRFKVVAHDVLNVGTNAELAKPGTYYWYGPQIGLAVYGEGALEGFTYTLGYERYEVKRGPLSNVDLFQTALNYDIGKSKLVSLQLKYQRGRNLDTLERLNQLTLGLGVKY